MPMFQTGSTLTESPYANDASNGIHAWLLPAIKAQRFKLPAGAKVIDVGCGNGSLTAAWAHRDW
jgi:2-polyprenyl-3-methyl-5-hydroxy-6-metoxy-1,4-benzoquinol methylase